MVPLLVTTAIRATAPVVSVGDRDDRLRLTLLALREWRRLLPALPIVICDGSGFDLSPYVKDLPGATADVEVLAFRNDIDRVSVLGKGYGEGQIVAHALANSHLLRQFDSFAKCTGKLWLTNYHACCNRFNVGLRIEKVYWDRWTTRYARCDTRFYISTKSFYARVLHDLHAQVDERRNFSLEHAFANRLLSCRIRRTTFPVRPMIFGVSGSTGEVYSPDRDTWGRAVKRAVRVCVGAMVPANNSPSGRLRGQVPVSSMSK